MRPESRVVERGCVLRRRCLRTSGISVPIGPHRDDRCLLGHLIKPQDQPLRPRSARRTSPGSALRIAATLSTVSSSGATKPSRSHLFTVDTDVRAAVANSRALTPAANRNQRRLGPPAPGLTRRLVGSTSNACAKACRLCGVRGRASPLSHRETRCPSASPIRRARSFWLSPEPLPRNTQRFTVDRGGSLHGSAHHIGLADPANEKVRIRAAGVHGAQQRSRWRGPSPLAAGGASLEARAVGRVLGQGTCGGA